jgi:superfamily II DNA or RNA helicase
MTQQQRNDPCHCGSGKKYKNCCLASAREAQRNKLLEASAKPPQSSLLSLVPEVKSTTSLKRSSEISHLGQDALADEFQLDERFLMKFARDVSLYSLQVRRDSTHFYIESVLEANEQFVGVRYSPNGDISFAGHNLEEQKNSCALLIALLNPLLQDKLLARYENIENLRSIISMLPAVFSALTSATPIRLNALIIQVPKLRMAAAEPQTVMASELFTRYRTIYSGLGPFAIQQENPHSDYLLQGLGFDCGLAFLFSDGTLVPATAIDRHPYGTFLGDDWFKDSIDGVGGSERLNNRGMWFNSDPTDYRVSALDQLRVKIFSAALAGLKSKNLQLLLTSSFDSLHEPVDRDMGRFTHKKNYTPKNILKTMSIHSVQVLTAKDFKWSVNAKLELTAESKNITSQASSIGNGWLWDATKKCLTMTPVVEVQTELIRQTRPLGGKHTIKFKEQKFVSQLTDIEFIKFVRQRIESLGSTLEFEGLRQLSPESVRLSLHFRSTDPDSLRIGVSISEQSFHLDRSTLQRLAHWVASRTCGGLESYNPYIRYAATSTRNQEVRKADLKLIKHQGFHRALLLTTIELLEDQQQFKKKKDLYKKILQRLKERTKFVFPDQEDFTRAVSKSMTRAVEEAIELIVDERDQPRKLLSKAKDEFVEIDASELELRLSHQILNAMIEVDGLDALQKQATKALHAIDITGLPHGENELFELRHPNASAIAMRYLGRTDVELKVDGSAVETLPESALSALIECGAGTDKGDWFDLHPQVFLHGQPISDVDARRFVEGGFVPYGGKVYFVDRKKLPTAKWLDFFWRKIQSRGNKKQFDRSGPQIVHQQRHQILTLLGLKLAGLPVIGGVEWQKALATFERLTNPSSENSSASKEVLETKLPLKPFQISGAAWLVNLYDLGMGGILADDMGLGKTIQAIGLLRVLQNRNELGSSLVVVPSSLIHNWQSEIERFAPKLPVQVIASGKAAAQLKDSVKDSGLVTVTTYGILNENFESFAEIPWNVVTFDEAQNLKNIKSKRAGAARLLGSKMKFCLTGTPLENHYGEYYSLVDLCVPGALGPYDEFCSTYVPSSAGKAREIATEDIDFLRMKTAPLVLRRLKSAILSELPEKTETVIKLEFEKDQRKIYRDAALSWNKNIQELIDVKGESKSQLQMLTALLRLRQICSAPQTLPNTKYKAIPPKFNELLAALTELSEKGEPVVVFTNFRQTLIQLDELLKKQGIFCLSITGSTPTAQRAKILQDFERAQGHVVLLMTQNVGGVGLNLTKSSYVFHLEPWWNPQVENQASDRVHRIGQRRAVQIYRYIMQDSVEEKIQELKNVKSQLFDQLFESESPESEVGQFSSARLSKEDFLWLVGEQSKT